MSKSGQPAADAGTITKNENDDVRIQVRQAYGSYAERFQTAAGSSCCGPDETTSERVIKMYETADVSTLPTEVTGMALGCGDPVTLAGLQPGQTVLDLGSGAGIDCFLAAQRVGPSGRVIGVDMTPAMLEKARANQRKVGAANVAFRLGEIEHLPVADETVDVVISNCVINLSPDKPQVFREAFRVLKGGGLLSVSDIMTDGPLPELIKRNAGAWASCIGGALEESHYLAAIRDAGFVDVEIERVYPDRELVEAELAELGLAPAADNGAQAVLRIGDEVQVLELGELDDTQAMPRAFSGKIRARKPVASLTASPARSHSDGSS